MLVLVQHAGSIEKVVVWIWSKDCTYNEADANDNAYLRGGVDVLGLMY